VSTVNIGDFLKVFLIIVQKHFFLLRISSKISTADNLWQREVSYLAVRFGVEGSVLTLAI